MNRHTTTPHTLTHTLYTQTDPTTTPRFQDRVLEEITETIQGFVGDERAAISL